MLQPTLDHHHPLRRMNLYDYLIIYWQIIDNPLPARWKKEKIDHRSSVAVFFLTLTNFNNFYFFFHRKKKCCIVVISFNALWLFLHSVIFCELNLQYSEREKKYTKPMIDYLLLFCWWIFAFCCLFSFSSCILSVEE